MKPFASSNTVWIYLFGVEAIIGERNDKDSRIVDPSALCFPGMSGLINDITACSLEIPVL